jgi:RNA polymerase sigma-70 factor (ECF subfamily)
VTPPTASSAPRDLRDESDEALVARLGRRDDGALRELHVRYAPLVFTVAARFVGTANAEEVVQDVFVTLWEKHASFDPGRGAFRPWLVQVARRRALNGLRRTKGAETRDPECFEEMEGDFVGPDEATWLAHRRAVVRAAVDALPEAQRRALSLAFFDELTHEQVAEVLGTRLGTTKTRIRIALKRLAPALLVALAVVLAVFALRDRDERAAHEEALRMVTASDVVSMRLAPGPEAPAEAHGTYRTRPGARVAVLTTSQLPAVSGKETYVAWAHDLHGWRRLGPVVVESDGRSLLVVQLRPGEATPDELRVTRTGPSPGEAPSGPTLLAWPSNAGPR